MNLLAIDPGAANHGIALFGKNGYIKSWTLELSMKQADAERLWQLASGIRDIVREHYIEEIAFESFFAGHFSRSALDIPESIGAIKSIAGALKLPIYAYSPSTVKKRLTGNGRCKKPEIIEAVAKIVGRDFSLVNNHEVDAIAVGICHLNKVKFNRSM